MNKQFLNEFITDVLGVDYCGFGDNSFDSLVYSEYKVKLSFKHKFYRQLYIPFKYKGEDVWIVTESIIIRRPI